MATISVFHIDPNQLFREGLRRILANTRFNIDGEATTLSEGVDGIVQKVPAIVIIDISDSGGTLAALMQELDAMPARPRVVVLTESLGLLKLTDALVAGVDGYLLKNMSPDALEQSLSLVLMGEKVFPTDLAYLLINNKFVPHNGETAVGSSNGLSGREVEILSCLVNGHSNKNIANRLRIAEGTVKVHLKGILKKIRVTNRTQAAIWALQNGIITPAIKGEDRPGRPASFSLLAHSGRQ